MVGRGLGPSPDAFVQLGFVAPKRAAPSFETRARAPRMRPAGCGRSSLAVAFRFTMSNSSSPPRRACRRAA